MKKLLDEYEEIKSQLTKCRPRSKRHGVLMHKLTNLMLRRLKREKA